MLTIAAIGLVIAGFATGNVAFFWWALALVGIETVLAIALMVFASR